MVVRIGPLRLRPSLRGPVSQYILSSVYFILGIVYSIREDSILLVWNIRCPDILSLSLLLETLSGCAGRGRVQPFNEQPSIIL